jgi:hypothetical protein
MSAKPTFPQAKALSLLQQGLSLRGRTHATTYRVLKAKGWIADADTITEAGRKVAPTPVTTTPT